jgi:hypothetical protein
MRAITSQLFVSAALAGLLFTGVALGEDPVVAEPKPESKPRTLLMEPKDAGAKVEITVPAGVVVHSAKDEPMDWDYAVVDAKDQFDLGVRADIKKPEAAGKTEEELHQSYLENIHQLYDPKIKSKKAASDYTLANGKKVFPYVYQSEYWKTRLVFIIPAEKTVTTFEFNAPGLEELNAKAPMITEIIGSWVEK